MSPDAVPPDATDTDDADRGVASGRPPSMLLGLTLFSSAVATAALVVAAITRSTRPAIWILGVWAVLVFVCSYRALAMRVRHPGAFAALRTARRQLPAGAYELRSMAADNPEALERLVGEACAQADAVDRTLFIEVEDGDEMTQRWAGLGFAPHGNRRHAVGPCPPCRAPAQLAGPVHTLNALTRLPHQHGPASHPPACSLTEGARLPEPCRIVTGAFLTRAPRHKPRCVAFGPGQSLPKRSRSDPPGSAPPPTSPPTTPRRFLSTPSSPPKEGDDRQGSASHNR